MSTVTDFEFHLEIPQVPARSRVHVNFAWVPEIDVVVSTEEKEYQRLMSEKLKVVADWDLHDSKQLSIKK